MTIKEDLAKYPCFLFEFGTLRPIPAPEHWSAELQAHHFVPKSQEKTNPKFFKRVEHLQKIIFMPARTHYNLHAMGEDTFYKRYGIDKCRLLFNRLKWREGAYDEPTNRNGAEDLSSAC
jgi:hypothetical protein